VPLIGLSLSCTERSVPSAEGEVVPGW
jgi:hypothetical protein